MLSVILLVTFGGMIWTEYNQKMSFVEQQLSATIQDIASAGNSSDAPTGIILSTDGTGADSSTREDVEYTGSNENIQYTYRRSSSQIGTGSNLHSSTYIPIILYKIDYEHDILLPIGDHQTTLTDQSLSESRTKFIPAEYGFSRDGSNKLCFVKMNTNKGDIIAFTDVTAVDSYIEDIIRMFSMVIVSVVFILGILVWFASGKLVQPVRNAWVTQRRFVADASHELKTPVAVIMADCDVLLADPTISPETRKWTQNTRDEAETMKQLIGDMLELTATAGANVYEDTEEIDLGRETMRKAMQSEARAFEKNNVLEYDDIEQDLMIKVNRKEIERLIGILIDNACKYCYPDTTITISAHAERKHHVLAVSDIGERIPEDKEEMIFDRFVRMDEARSGANGYGLGLFMAKNIVEKYNGSISAHTDDDGVTTFTVKFPKHAPKGTLLDIVLPVQKDEAASTDSDE